MKKLKMYLKWIFETNCYKRNNQVDKDNISLKEFNSIKETNYLLSGKNRDIILASIAEVVKGKKL